MNILLLIIIILVLIVIFYLINNILKSKEHMSMKDPRLQESLENYGFEIDIEELSIIKKENGSIVFKKEYPTRFFNNNESHNIAKNKPLSNSIFKKNRIPVPDHVIIDENNKDKFIYEYDISFPCVLKPVDGMQGKDVNTFIKNKEQFINILNDLLKKYKSVMLENQVYGDNYRIFLFNNQIMDVVKREQPFILGDGSKSVTLLINEKNNLLTSKKLYPTTNIDWIYIKEQGYLKDEVPEKDKKIFITNTINFHNGANPVRVKLDEIPEINKNMFIKAHKLIKLECSGLDYMSDDITIPYDRNNGHIIEINDMVDSFIHVKSDNSSKPNFLFENIAKSFNL
jgi:D-alanine-D-alanine ligase-like ATP-grasp enzyme